MAFTGTAVVKQVSDSEVRITGLSLAAGAGGTIALHGFSGTPGVRLPASFDPEIYKGPDGTDVALSDMIDVTIKLAAATPTPLFGTAVVKTGAGPLHWEATITNTDGSTATPALEIYVKFPAGD